MQGFFAPFAPLLKRRRFNGILFAGFMRLLLVAAALLAALVAYLYFSSAKAFDREFATANDINASRVRDMADMAFREVEYMSSSVLLDGNIQMYILSENPGAVMNNLEARVREKLRAYQDVNRHIHSIYVYSEQSGFVCTAAGSRNADDFDDNGWLELVRRDMPENFAVVPRAMQGIYPYVLTFVKKSADFGVRGGVIVNLDIQALGKVFDTPGSESQNVYLVGRDGGVIYSRDQGQMLKQIEPGSLIDIAARRDGIFEEGAESYAASSAPSRHYDWRYLLVTTLSGYQGNLARTRNALLIFAPCALLAGAALSFLLSASATRPFSKVMELLDYSGGRGRAENELSYATTKIISLIDDNKELRDELGKRLAQYNSAQLLALQTQISPHFINNTLNMIYLLAAASLGPDHAVSRMLIGLSRILKFSLETDDILVPLKTELAFAEEYVLLLQHRYRDIFRFETDVAPGVSACRISRLCLQSLIENAVYHGICPKKAPGTVTVRAWAEGENVMLSVGDDGVGISPERLAEINASLADTSLAAKHIGVKNVYLRLKLLFAEQAALSLESSPGGGTTVTLKMPRVDGGNRLWRGNPGA
jgi:two-component system sensor histidine kinase YesM